MTLSFNSNGSHRLTAKIKTMFPGAYSAAASLGSKRRSFIVSNFKGDFGETKEKLKTLGCTRIELSKI